MANSKVKTVIVNRTQHELVLRVGTRNCFAKLATIVVKGEHILEIDVNWTYQEFALEPANIKSDLVLKNNKLILSSDDCCDFERMTVTECGGKLQVDKVDRGQLNCNADHQLPELTNWRSYFTWPPTWPRLNWKLWL